MTKPRKPFGRVASMVAQAPHETGVVVFFTPLATEAQIAAVLAHLNASPYVARLGITNKPDV